MMDSITQKTPAIKYVGRRKNVVWLQPILVAEIEYRAWTDDGKLRHASYKGMRDREDSVGVYGVD
jgi:bifunctional non-homologous end joining protein LigD